MSKYTKETLAALLNGREYRSEITKEETAEAKASGLVVVFGYSDDNAEMVGAINDEVGCYEGGDFRVDAKGLLEDWEELEKRHKEEVAIWLQRDERAFTVKAIWDQDGYSWTYKTSLPHATFDILKDGEKYCRGIVFELPE